MRISADLNTLGSKEFIGSNNQIFHNQDSAHFTLTAYKFVWWQVKLATKDAPPEMTYRTFN